MNHPLATFRGTVANDAFYFSVLVNGRRVDNLILDTGAFELTFNDTIAQELALPNLGPIQIGGVGGTAQAYLSECNLDMGGHTFANVPCIVDPGFSDVGLFGLRFFIDNQLKLELDPVQHTLTITKA